VPKDRDQLTPAEPDDIDQLGPRRSAEKAAEGPVPTKTGPTASGADPKAADEVGADEAEKYR
jgi:hypothetical protein